MKEKRGASLVSIFPEISKGVSDGSGGGVFGGGSDAEHIPELSEREGDPEIGLSPEGEIFPKEKESRSDEPIRFFRISFAFFGVRDGGFRMNDNGKSGAFRSDREVGIFVVKEKTLVEESDHTENRNLDERSASR